MSDFSVNFTNPWLLFLFIPAVALSLIPYFRLSKKYRRTRNRVISVALHLIVLSLTILVLAGISFSYNIPNTSNEVMLVVDASVSDDEAETSKNAFIKSVVDESDSMFKIGIVTFGRNQIYAAELSNDNQKVYEQYLAAEKPDGTATDIAAALNFAKDKFTNPAAGKIVLISDGAETDGSALNMINALASEGLRVDTVQLSPVHGDEVLILSAAAPDFNVLAGQEINFTLTLQSSYKGTVEIAVSDNGVESTPIEVEIDEGVQSVELPYTFAEEGMHELRFSVKGDGDTLNENNQYYTYLNIKVYNKILIIQGGEGESNALKNALGTEDFELTSISVGSEDMPNSLDKLREYDEVLLMNVSNKDLPAGFDEILYSYVNDIGGGLFTVGGNRTENGRPVANTYNRNEIKGSLLQQLLPVQVIEYTPPMALMIIIDRSGSMYSSPDGEKSLLDYAKDGAKACLNALSARDYCGIIALSDSTTEAAQLLPVTQKNEIIEAIDNIPVGGGTRFAPSVNRAASALAALTTVENRHIILVTDGEPQDQYTTQTGSEEGGYGTGYGDEMRRIYETMGISTSIVCIKMGLSNERQEDMRQAAAGGGGSFYNVQSPETLTFTMRQDLGVDNLKVQEFVEEQFTPEVGDHTVGVLNGVSSGDIPALGGYYGTRKKPSAEAPLMGEYVPVYAQWNYGKGVVGSFMCDLNGTWSRDFLASEAGVTIIKNILTVLMPTEDIRAHGIEAPLTEDNYSNRMSIYTELSATDTVEVTINGPAAGGGTTVIKSDGPYASDGYSRLSFTADVPGLYRILIQRKNEAGEVTASLEVYKAFSYSGEYNIFNDVEECKAFLESLAVGGGSLIEEGWQVFEDYSRTIHREINPAMAFIITAIVLFLLDIAVRKFKFKWPHEIYRDYKAKKALGADEGRQQ